MSDSQLIQFLKKRSMLLSFLTVLPMVVVILGLTACVKHPVGDPEKSKVDPAFTGVWKATDQDSFLILRPYDSRTYLVDAFEFQNDKDRIEPKSREEYKAWLTSIGGETFITMEPLGFAQFTGEDDESLYFVAKFKLVGGSIHLRLLDGENKLLKQAGNRRELEAAIAKHVKSDSLYADPAMVFAKNENKALIKTVIDAFYTWGSDES